jgi:hypothetical protein
MEIIMNERILKGDMCQAMLALFRDQQPAQPNWVSQGPVSNLLIIRCWRRRYIEGSGKLMVFFEKSQFSTIE